MREAKSLLIIMAVAFLTLVTQIFLPASVLADPPDPPPHGFVLKDFKGRYVSAENAYDISSVHDAGGGNVGSPIVFAATAVIIADGKGFVCGESDGFYGGFPPPGVNLGPSFFHGTYTVSPIDGRIVITTCEDSIRVKCAVAGCAICADKTPCVTDGSVVYKTQVGYLQDKDAKKVTTVEQINSSDASLGGCCATTGFLVHKREWARED
jgi:hypothetical protein